MAFWVFCKKKIWKLKKYFFYIISLHLWNFNKIFSTYLSIFQQLVANLITNTHNHLFAVFREKQKKNNKIETNAAKHLTVMQTQPSQPTKSIKLNAIYCDEIFHVSKFLQRLSHSKYGRPCMSWHTEYKRFASPSSACRFINVLIEN